MWCVRTNSWDDRNVGSEERLGQLGLHSLVYKREGDFIGTYKIVTWIDRLDISH